MTQLALGAYHSCALFESGRVACWGDNQLGQLGNGSDTPSRVPLLLDTPDDVVEVRAGDATTCARQRAGTVWCWGANAYGQADPNPDPAIAPSSAPVGTYDSTGEPAPFAPTNVRRKPIALTTLAQARSLALGARHGCVLFDDGHVTCWGDGSLGQLGPGAPRDAFQRHDIAGLPPLVELDSAGLYSCGRTAGGEVWCWGGENEHAQLGTPEPGPAPRRVGAVSGAIGLELNANRACARLAGEQQVCWGDSGGCSDTVQAAAARVTALDGSLDFVRAPGGCFWCVLRASHALECGATPDRLDGPTLVGVATVAAGNDHACAALSDGSVQCWGSNVRGELGRKTAAERDSEPGPVEWPTGDIDEHWFHPRAELVPGGGPLAST